MPNLVIVESPSKAATIKGYLGANYKVVASKGHVRDLPKSTLGVDIENDFAPHYINIRGKGDLIKEIKKEAKSAGFCVTELDRNDLVEDIRRLPKPCGILAASDYFAIEAHHAATVGCFKIPEDIAIAGIDNNEQICDRSHSPASVQAGIRRL